MVHLLSRRCLHLSSGGREGGAIPKNELALPPAAGDTHDMRTYGQYCPVARTSELLAERWTPIIIRNLLTGCRTFGDLLAGAPGISKALLAQRLELLEAHGILI